MHSQPLTSRWVISAQRPPFSLALGAANLLMLAFLLGMTLVDQDHLASQINRIVGMVMVVICVLCFIPYRLKLQPEVLLFGAFVLWCAIVGLPVAEVEALTLRLLRLLAQVWAMVFAVAGFAMAKKSASFHFFIVICCGVFLAAYAQTTGDYQTAMEAGEDTRASSSLANPNTFGFVMLYGIMSLTYFWGMLKLRLWRFVLPALAVVFALSLLASGSRKSFVVCLAYIIAWLWFCYRKQVLRRLPAFLLVSGVLVAACFLTAYMFEHTYMGERFRQPIGGGGTGTRIEMYQRGIELFLERPIAGVGLGNYEYVSGLGAFSHSDYIEVLCSAGMVGFVLYFAVYVVLWRRLSRIRKLSTDPVVQYRVGVFKAVILAMLCLGFGAPSFLSIYFWFIFASMIGYTCAVEKDLKNPQRRPFPTSSLAAQVSK